ncbi:uncharacterized protein [Apostichopus japonicus]|uniref:uncharacterized protein n=1 Tax=Stichopus japonicus TaxID=307972 RepID=UPI003AB294DF
MVNSPNPANLLGSILSAEKDLAFIGAAVGDGGVTSSGVISQLASWENISSTCLQDVSTYLQDLLTLKAYALKMLVTTHHYLRGLQHYDMLLTGLCLRHALLGSSLPVLPEMECYFFVGNTVLSFSLAFCLSLLIKSPAVAILKNVLRRSK